MAQLLKCIAMLFFLRSDDAWTTHCNGNRLSESGTGVDYQLRSKPWSPLVVSRWDNSQFADEQVGGALGSWMATKVEFERLERSTTATLALTPLGQC